MKKVYIGLIGLSVVLCCVFGALFLKDALSPSPSAATRDSASTNDEAMATLDIGDCAVLPLNEEDQAAVEQWSSGNEQAVSVDCGGRVDALMTGDAIVSAQLSDGRVKRFYVRAQAADTSVSYDPYSGAITANSEQLTRNLKDKSGRLPFEIHVNRSQNVVTVYTYDENGEYTVPVRAMICSCGINNSTTIGTFYIYSHTEWHPLVNNVFGQYASAFSDDLLFHSVPYNDLSKDTIKTYEFNKLGTPASKGCVRMSASDCQWICDNCAADTVIKIFDSDDLGPLGKPEMIKISDHNIGWDPTDRDPENPYRGKTPQITGAKDVTLQKGNSFDPHEGVAAFDSCGTDVSDQMEVIGNVDPDRPGTYRVTYRITDGLHRSAETTVTVTVE